ncbi:MAG: ribosome small subunit-dependent GTPase A [Chloroflexota bacterium]|jgi:ribosome biogenesis GTPase
MSATTNAPLLFDQLGWSADRASSFAPLEAAGYVPGRLVSSAGQGLAVTRAGPTEIVIQRRFARETATTEELPAVGDWLALEPVSDRPRQGALREVLPRTGTFVRQRLPDGRPQVLAANVDTAFLVSGLDHDLNLRRIERYLVLALDGGVTPVVVLNKVDIALDLVRAVTEVHAVAAGTRVVVTSALDGTGLDELRGFLEPGLTACLLGSSGVGKSTLTNALLGEERQLVRALREDDSKGRHTTSHRELFAVPDAGLLIDTPGLRTVGVLGEEESLGATFDEVESLARACRFSDCRHETEPGCAVRAAVEAGTLSPARLASHHKLEAERHSAALRADERARREADRKLGRFYKRHLKELKRREHKDF